MNLSIYCLLLEVDASGMKSVLDIVVDHVGVLLTVDNHDSVLGLKVVDNRHGGLDESDKPLSDRLNVVVGSARGLSSLPVSYTHLTLPTKA